MVLVMRGNTPIFQLTCLDGSAQRGFYARIPVKIGKYVCDQCVMQTGMGFSHPS